MVSVLRERELGIRRPRLHETPFREHQRSAHPGVGPKISLGTQSLTSRAPGFSHLPAVLAVVSLRFAFNWSLVISRSHRLTTTVATPLPIRLVMARHSLMNRSMPTS